MVVKIESRRDYELHVKQTVSKMAVSNKHKSIVRLIVMKAFDDGIAMNMNKLTVETGE